jgi:hypothetical protein
LFTGKEVLMVTNRIATRLARSSAHVIESFGPDLKVLFLGQEVFILKDRDLPLVDIELPVDPPKIELPDQFEQLPTWESKRDWQARDMVPRREMKTDEQRGKAKRK